MKKYLFLTLLLAGMAAAPKVLAVATPPVTGHTSTISGTLTTGLSSGPQVVVVVPPSASPDAGTYTSTQNVVLTATGSQSIHYTTDGTEPTCTTASTYSAAIPVSATLTVKAISCYPDSHASTVASFTYTINTPAAPSSPSGGGGGGGGGSFAPSSPFGTISVAINGTATTTSSRTVTLTLTATGATQMIISNAADLSGSSWQTFATTTTWTLPAGDGIKAVYAKFKNASNESSVVSDTITLYEGKVLGESTALNAHPNGTLILDGKTIYLIENRERHGFRDPQEYASYGYRFDQAVPVIEADSLLPVGDIMKAMTGTLALDTSDNRTVYMVGKNATKRGFASYSVFTGLGYAKGSGMSGQAVNGMFKINMTDYPAGLPITSATEPHPEGALVRQSNGTIWWILDGKRSGFESEAVYNTYGFTFDRAVPANAADLALSEGPLVKFRDGTLVRDGTVYYIITDGQKMPFASVQSLASWGYKTSNVITANLSTYTQAPTTLP